MIGSGKSAKPEVKKVLQKAAVAAKKVRLPEWWSLLFTTAIR